MSLFNSVLEKSASFFTNEFGSNFRFDRGTVTLVGIFNEHDKTEDLEAGGFVEGIDAILEVWKSEIAAKSPGTIPTTGVRLIHGGKTYVIKGVSEDSFAYKLILTGINK